MLKKGELIHRGTPFVSMVSKDYIKSYCNFCFLKLSAGEILGRVTKFLFTFDLD